MMALFNHIKGESDKQYIPAKVITPGVRVPNGIYYPWLCLKALGYLVYYTCVALCKYVKLAWATVPATVFVFAGFAYEPWAMGILALAVAGMLALWWWQARPSFWKFCGWFYIAQWNRYFVYARLWQGICTNLRLVTAFEGDKYYPRIVKVRRDAEGDILTVQMLGGQHPADWIKHAARFAYAYDALSATIKTAPGKFKRNRISIHLRTRDALAKTVAPFAVPAVPEIAKLFVALRSSGRKVAVSLRTHLLIAGASDAGKGSVLWAITSALSAGIRDGLVRVYAFDPKGGVELGVGELLFQRFFYGPTEEMIGGLEEIVAEMSRRKAAQKRKQQRDHIPTSDSPSIVVMIDEFGALTGYVGDKKTKDRIASAMSLILSQGRAVGVHVVAALQDPRKEILPFRNLFHSRIALRLNEESEVALILSDDAADMGAACHEIPESMPGTGYMILPDSPQPERVRFPFHTNKDIMDLADTYGKPAPESVEPVVPHVIPVQNGAQWRVNR